MTWNYPQKIETAARVYMAELITHARRLDDRKDTYTPKGMVEAWATATARIAEQITALEIKVNATAAALEAVGEFYRARVMPPAPAALDAGQVIKTWHAHIGTAWITELKMGLQSMEHALAHEQAPHELQQLRAADILAPLGDPAAVAIADSGELKPSPRSNDKAPAAVAIATTGEVKPAPSSESVETAESTAAEAG